MSPERTGRLGRRIARALAVPLVVWIVCTSFALAIIAGQNTHWTPGKTADPSARVTPYCIPCPVQCNPSVCPPPCTVTVTGVGVTVGSNGKTAAVSWTDSPAGTDAFVYGQTPAYGLSATPSGHSVALTGLTAGTVYYYYITDTVTGVCSGTGVGRAAGSFWTSSTGGGTCPKGTITLTLTTAAPNPNDASQFRLAWTYSPSPTTPIAATVSVAWSSAGGQWSANPSGSAYTLTGLAASTAYYYSVSVSAPCYNGGLQSGGFTTPAVTFSSLTVNANTNAGNSATISWVDNYPGAAETFAWGSSAGSYPNSVPPSNHQVAVSGLTPHDTYYYQLCGTWTGAMTCDVGSFHTTDISVQKSYDYLFPSPSYSTCGGASNTGITLNAAATFPGDIIYNQYNATTYYNSNTNFAMVFNYNALGTTLGCWPWSFGVQSTRVDVYAIDTTNPNDNFLWLGTTNSLITSWGATGSPTVSWSFSGTAGGNSGTFGASVSVAPLSATWSVTPSNTVTTGTSASSDYLGYFQFNWPAQIQTSFGAVWNLLVNDQQAQHQYLNDIQFAVIYTYVVGEFFQSPTGGVVWSGTSTYTDSVTVGACYINNGAAWTLSNQCTDIQQGTDSEP